jgi:hypothetical protein
MTNHPITPPPELVEQWECEYHHATSGPDFAFFISERAAQWGANQELEECCKLFESNSMCGTKFQRHSSVRDLRDKRRPKPQSLKNRALKAALIELDPKGKNGSLIFQALEQLND